MDNCCCCTQKSIDELRTLRNSVLEEGLELCDERLTCVNHELKIVLAQLNIMSNWITHQFGVKLINEQSPFFKFVNHDPKNEIGQVMDSLQLNEYELNPHPADNDFRNDEEQADKVALHCGTTDNHNEWRQEAYKPHEPLPPSGSDPIMPMSEQEPNSMLIATNEQIPIFQENQICAPIFTADPDPDTVLHSSTHKPLKSRKRKRKKLNLSSIQNNCGDSLTIQAEPVRNVTGVDTRNKKHDRRRHRVRPINFPPPATASSCRFCGKIINGNIRRHELIHTGVTGVRPFSCSHCPMTFIRSDHRKVHEFKIHLRQSKLSRSIKGTRKTPKTKIIV